MEKKLYYRFSDGADVSKVVMELSGAFEWIQSTMEEAMKNKDELIEDYEFTITPILLTEEEYNNLPEANI